MMTKALSKGYAFGFSDESEQTATNLQHSCFSPGPESKAFGQKAHPQIHAGGDTLLVFARLILPAQDICSLTSPAWSRFESCLVQTLA